MSAQPKLGRFPWPNGAEFAVSLSFDDARPSQVDVGLPLLAEYGAKATFYVYKPNVEQRLDDWRAAVAAGHDIGNHTLTHPCSGNFPFSRSNPLESYTLGQIEREIADAQAYIEDTLGVIPETFAYPCGQTFVGRGDATQSYVPIVARRFLAGRGFFNGRLNVPPHGDLAQVCGYSLDLEPFERLGDILALAREEGGWLVFAGHDVGPGGGQTVRSDTLIRLLEYALDPAQRIWLDTVAAVARHIHAHTA